MAMNVIFTPPRLSYSEGESSTVSRERRRVALAAKEVAAQVSEMVLARSVSIETKLEHLLLNFPGDAEARLERLETLTVCSPSVDEVLPEMLQRKGIPDIPFACCVPPFPLHLNAY